MVKIIGNDIWRADKKIGYIEGNHIRDYSDKRVGYFADKYVYNEDGHKVASIEEDYLVPYGGSNSTRVRLEQIAEDVNGGTIPALARAAIYILLGS